MCTFNPASAVQAGGLMYHSQVLNKARSECDSEENVYIFCLSFHVPRWIFSCILYAYFISGLLVWWAWSTKHAKDPWDRRQFQRERSPRSRIFSLLPSRTLRGTTKALAHVRVLMQSLRPRRYSETTKKQHKPPDSKSVFMKTALSGCETRCFSTSHALG